MFVLFCDHHREKSNSSAAFFYIGCQLEGQRGSVLDCSQAVDDFIDILRLFTY